ncbi:hypothetical protein BOTBODRAFT_190344 [Botryobasidium botryosum FD-172 SS1]|uniref:SnoaL-like domain-containing protein n=1 Tax=Botryobasidium botryosum (strain FD-172 SS1) TaxID=930990 RepID=A0A067M4J7_BOTB1|nr:hypothetical protein BOTBODRAFT_190344 [Botryobasidium botryosum FD-172 SS1]
MSTESPQLRTVREFLKGFDRVDFDLISAHTTEDVIYEVLPSSLGSKPYTKEEFRTHWDTYVVPKTERSKNTIIDSIEVPGKVFINGYFVEQPSGKKHEYNCRFDFEGDKIKLFKMFLDVETAKEYRYVDQ